MGAAIEIIADVMGIGADIKSLATDHPEIKLWGSDLQNLMGVNMNKSWFPLNGLPLTGELI
jgi:hypothetical protein